MVAPTKSRQDSGVAYAPVFTRTSSYGAEYGYPAISPRPDSSTLDPWPLGECQGSCRLGFVTSCLLS
jgi:hypothetical protein